MSEEIKIENNGHSERYIYFKKLDEKIIKDIKKILNNDKIIIQRVDD